MNGQPHFDIKVAEQVLDQAIMNNKPHYLIKWKYLPHQFDTWEPLQNLQSIAHLLQAWIRTKRNTKQLQTINNTLSSYFDTVNYIDPNKKTQKKRKPISKPFKKQKKNKFKGQKEIVILDEENESMNTRAKYEEDQDFIDDSQQVDYDQQYQRKVQVETRSIIEEEQKMNDCNYGEDIEKYNNHYNPQSFISERNQNALPLKFDPEQQDQPQQKDPLNTSKDSEMVPQEKQQSQNPKPVPTPAKDGMKVVGTVKSDQIQALLERFKFRDLWCFKIQIKGGRVTNMREEDVKKVCPQLLMEYYEDHGIKI